jgi:competence protein ComEA
MSYRSLYTLAFLLALPGFAVDADSSQQPLDVNTADQATIDSLPGVGPQEAAAIVAYRDQNGPYGSVEDLKQVPGVSSRSVDNVRGEITVGSESEFAKMQESKRFNGRP